MLWFGWFGLAIGLAGLVAGWIGCRASSHLAVLGKMQFRWEKKSYLHESGVLDRSAEVFCGLHVHLYKKNTV